MKNSIIYVLFLSAVLSACQKHDTPVVKQMDSKLITNWIGLHVRLIPKTTGVTHIAYSRHFSYTGIALYEALVNDAPHYRSIANRLNGNIVIPPLANKKALFYPAAANAAIAEMLRFFYSGKQSSVFSIDSLEQWHFAKFGAEEPSGLDLNASVDYGKKVAAVIIEWSKTDGSSNANSPYTPLGEGYWEPTPNAFAGANMPGWGNNRTLLNGSINGTIPAAPITFSKDASSPFFAMVKELYDASKELTNDQVAMAHFWDDAPNGKYVTVFGHWFNILRATLEKEKTPLMNGAEAFLRLGITMHEATISCWKTKYTYNQIRPVTYIWKHMGHTEWSPIISTPPHPEYSAAHATISASAGYALESVFGQNYSFVDHTYDGIGMSPRSFTSFEAAGKEAGMSRLYGGIHYRPSIETGNTYGKKVGANVFGMLKTR